MKNCVLNFLIFLAVISVPQVFLLNCGSSNRDAGKILTVEEAGQRDVDPAGNNNGGTTVVINSIFDGEPGIPISKLAMGAIDPDPTGHRANTDYDADGIPNDREIVSNAYVADYPRIVTRVSAPITMEIRISESSSIENHTETIEASDMNNTINNSMEDKHYTQANEKTTPYVTKESQSTDEASSSSYGYSNSVSASGGNYFFRGSASKATSQNQSESEKFARSTMSEKTVFEDVDYVDNLDRNGVEFSNETVQKISKNYRKSEVLKNTQNIGPNAGIVRAALFLKNLTINMPVKISNVTCTLTFRTPAGEFLPIKTFKLRNEDYSEFNKEIYGGEELGPYTIEVANLNTAEVKKALANGYVPQIHVVSYDMHRVEGSNYNPGVNNLKIVEETVKGRTAIIKVAGINVRELYRVAAFDVNENGDISPGISLKKALFNIFRSRVGTGEQWVDEELTVRGQDLGWKNGTKEHAFSDTIEGNSWDMFETYVKVYKDEYNREHKIETIKRIGNLVKYNPFSVKDNPSYNPNEQLTEEEFYKMKYFVIFHNGRYFDGDINDPIWVGERYEIICFDVRDFNQHFQNYYYTPLQSGQPFTLDTRWNRLSNDDNFMRAKNIGKVVEGDVIHLEVDLLESRYLFNPDKVLSSNRVGTPDGSSGDYFWSDFNYTFFDETVTEQGIPKEFRHFVEGGVNNIAVTIEESQYAERFKISFREAGNDTAPWRRVYIKNSELIKKSGKIVIQRNTPVDDADPVVPIGFIPGGIDYDVEVRAYGTVYGVPVSTGSINNGESRTFVYDAGAGEAPGSFSYSVTGYNESLDLRIDRAANTEFYEARIQGPFNYAEAGDSPPVVRKIVRAGQNTIKIEHGLHDVFDPGVYKVEVFALNDSTIGGGIPAENGDRFVLVDYERYKNQKLKAPDIRKAYYDLKAIDLEVNFNDGSGWYRLKLSNDDTGDRVIDCRYTSYIESDKQKFHIFFIPPSGYTNPLFPSLYNVFSSGREEVDVYVRTVNENKYRDTFWLKNRAGASYIMTPGLGVNNFIDFWVNNDYTDASYVEDSLPGPADSSFALVSDNTPDTVIDDFFFSPLEHRRYNIKTSITDALAQAELSQIDEAEFAVSVGEKSIIISSLESQFADSFRFYWKEVNMDDDFNVIANPMEINGSQWSDSDQVYASDLETDDKNRYTISSLTHNTHYLVAVVAINQFGKPSPPVFYRNLAGDVDSLVPITSVPPSKPETIAVNLGADGKSIVLSNINVPGELRYRVEWKRAVEDDTLYAFTEINAASGTDILTHTIPDLNYWDRYHVRVAGVTSTGVVGEYSNEVMVETVQEGVLPDTPGAAWVNISTYRSLRLNAGLLVSGINLPEGTSSYIATYQLSYAQGNRSGTVNDASSFYVLGNGTSIVDSNNVCDEWVCYWENYSVISKVLLTLNIKAMNEYGEELDYAYNYNLGTWYYSNGWKIQY